MRGFQLSESEFIEVCELANAGTVPGLSRTGRIVFAAVFLMFLAVALAFGVVEGEWQLALGFSGVIAALVLLFLLARFLWRRTWRNEYAARADIAEFSECHFDEDQIEWRGESGSKRLRWRQLDYFMENPEYYLLFENKAMGNVVPKRAFESDHEQQQFIKLLELNGIKRKR